MIGLLLGSGLRGALSIPFAIFGLAAGVLTMCACFRCRKCQLRDCICVKRFLRFIGHDEFDDFELMVLVHEAMFECSSAKHVTIVRITAGAHTVKTDPNSNGIFQQPLHIDVLQGTTKIIIELLDVHDHVLGSVSLDVLKDVYKRSHHAETIYPLKPGRRAAIDHINNPKVKLTMVVGSQDDSESGLLAASNMSQQVDILVRQQLRKAKAQGLETGEDEISEMDVLKKACAGPLEYFEGLGKTRQVYVAVLGPPISRRWVLGLWQDFADFQCKRGCMQEVDLLKVESVLADPTRHHVFVVNYFDESRVRQTLTFRRTDRARDVWVEILHLLVTKAREAKQQQKQGKVTTMRQASSTKSAPGKARLEKRIGKSHSADAHHF